MPEPRPAGLRPRARRRAFARAFPQVSFRRQEGEAVRDHSLYLPAEPLVEVCTFLRDDPELRFAMLSWVGGVDYLPREPRFELVYHLLSIAHHGRFVLKVQVGDENPARVPR